MKRPQRSRVSRLIMSCATVTLLFLLAAAPEKGGKAMELTSAAFKSGEAIPRKHTADGLNLSPPLSWPEPPEEVKSLALICEDPDAPVGTWVHWVVYNILPDVHELPEGVPAKPLLPNEIQQGYNDFGKVGYGGPAPPAGKLHRYFFRLYGLDAELALKGKVNRKKLEAAMKGHILAEAALMGTYKR